ncbi:MAG: zinc-ribbon domain containing protein [Candidatus Zixiibacteriota bacterium]
MQNGFEPRILICTECNQEFVFTAAAQAYFAERGYSADPKRCKACHTKYKKEQRNSNYRSEPASKGSSFQD